MREILDHIQLRPKFCVWEITFTCNMRCLHCASRLNEGWTRGEELSLEEIRRVGKELAALGCEKVILSGGEALLRPDWESIARYLVSLGLKVSLISNGLIIDGPKARRIKDAGICRVALSLDGLASTHNYIRQHPDSFHRVRRAFDALKEQDLPVNFVTHINRLNLPELGAMEEFISGLGADVWRLQLGSPVGRMESHPELLVQPEDLPEIADFIVAAKNRGRVTISVGDNIGYFSPHEAALRHTPNRQGWDFWCGCAAGCLNIGIESQGDVKGCLSLQSERFVEGNVRNQSLREIWQKKGSFSYNRDFQPENLHGYCYGCEFGEICRGGCVFMAYGATGSPHNNPYCLHRVMKKGAAPALPQDETSGK